MCGLAPCLPGRGRRISLSKSWTRGSTAARVAGLFHGALTACGSDQSAALALHVLEARQRRRETQFFRIGRINPGNKRLHEPVERLTTKPPAHEAREAFVAAILAAPRNEILPGHPQLAERTEDRRLQDRPDATRGHEHKAIG